MQPMAVSVVIPSHNDSLEKCLHALDNQSISHELYEVIVVDNYSDKVDLKKQVANYQHFSYLRENRKGAYFARNHGWRRAIAPIVAFTDADCVPDAYWLKNIIKFFLNKKEYAMGGSIIKINPNNWIERNVRHLADGQKSFRYKPYLPNYPYVVAANMAFRKSLLSELNGFDEEYISGGDGDFCWRLKEKGYSLKLFPQAIVYHPCRSTIQSYYKQNYHYGKGHPIQFKKWYKHKIKVFFDLQNCKDLFKNFFMLPISLIIYLSGKDKRETFYKNLLEVTRSIGLILGRIRGSLKHKVIYI